MTGRFLETLESRKRRESVRSKSSATLEWIRWPLAGEPEIPNDQQVEIEALAEMPLKFRELIRRQYELEHLGGGLYLCKAQYEDPNLAKAERPDVGEFKFQFSTSGATAHITQAISQTTYARSGATAPDFKGAIGVGRNREIKGVDVPIPQLDFTLFYRQPKAVLSLDYIADLMRLTGRTNAEPFMSFDAGELLFMGADGGDSSEGDPEVTYAFKASPNLDSVALNSELTTGPKKGHEYVWTYYDDDEDASAKTLIARPLCASVAQIHYTGDFGKLQITI